MIKPNKFWDLRSAKDDKSADLFIYGAIISGYKWNETDVTIKEFTQALNDLSNSVKTLNMYVNSPGGSVFTTIAMINQLERKKSNLTINAYVDGIAASAASFLIMKADNIYMYKNTFLMIHKPMISLWGANAVECREQADWLDKTELKTCRPAYLSQGTALLTDEKLNELLDGKDNWLDSDQAAELFNVTVLNEEKDAIACADFEMLKGYDGIPSQLLNQKINKSSSMDMKRREKIAAEAKAGVAYIETILGGMYQ
ncbi:Clp protease ClpP [Brevibacillus laterosporus]|uniref:head maturation protease, ClpP-related n=1 Tax=Brevibacillus laterosporus TaxID=1465 RepID=UPI000CE5505F|nr:head maturation protease, ClpP-related [Brevibacillus laterosporus]PPA82513.1 Clp protease ClpP [Brevibacillus laterosporus]